MFSLTFSSLLFLFPPPFSPFLSLFFFILGFAAAYKKKYFSVTLSIVSTFLVHQFPSPFTVISLFSNTFSCPQHSPFFLKVSMLPSPFKKKLKKINFFSTPQFACSLFFNTLSSFPHPPFFFYLP